jgi:DtxR family manganese transport transcriptional regulator
MARTRTTRPAAAAPPDASSRPVSAQAASHARTRKAHASELAEDYVEIIAELIETTGEARVVDIAERLGVSHVTVIRTLARLQKSGLVTTRPYRSIFLTDDGRKLADHSRKRHDIVLKFLLSLGIPPAIAHADAEGIEHHVSPATLAAFEKHTRAR